MKAQMRPSWFELFPSPHLPQRSGPGAPGRRDGLTFIKQLLHIRHFSENYMYFKFFSPTQIPCVVSAFLSPVSQMITLRLRGEFAHIVQWSQDLNTGGLTLKPGS